MWIDYLNKINSDASILYIVIRTFIIYFYAILLIRIDHSRFNFQTAFDYIFIITIGSVLARTINGTSTLLAAIIGSGLLVGLHWLVAEACFYFPKFGNLIKGRYSILIKDGEINPKVMKKHAITHHDLEEIIREKLHDNNFDNIKEARIERTGRITFIAK